VLGDVSSSQEVQVINADALRQYGFTFLLMAAILFAPLARGQNANSGELRGLVTDASGAAVADVTVTIANVQTGVTTSTKTNGSGIYDAPSVPIGEYTVTFSKGGFRDFVRKGLVIDVRTITIDATLQIGAGTEQIVVTAEAPLLQTDTSDQQVNFDTKEVLNAPIVGGVWFEELTKVLPGLGGGGASGGQSVAVNGAQQYSANFQIDGSAATDPRDVNASNHYPPVDSIDEVSISTSNGGAQTGNSMLSLNVNLKTGTNRFHGSAYEFIQNDVFNSRNFFNSGKKAPERWNEYGGSIGGPIVKNKLFFFFNYQRNPVNSGSVQNTTVPTENMRQGIFTDPIFHATIFDKNSCSGNCARTALNGGSNILLTNQIDPVAAAILKFIPHPAGPNASAFTNNFQIIVSKPNLSQWYVAKIDYQISKNHRLSGSVFEYPQTLTFDVSALCGLGFDCTTSTPNNRNQAQRITETWTVSPTVINEFRIGSLREHDRYSPATFGRNFLTQIGMQPQYGSNTPVNIFPSIFISNSASGVNANTNITGGNVANLVEQVYTASDVLTLVRGRHTLKLGGELDRQFQYDQGWGNFTSGQFTFNGIGTNSGTSADPRNGGNTGNGIPFADFLLGDVGKWNVFNNVGTDIASWITSAFANDDFKVSSRLTLNLGLRYQHQTGWAVASNKFGNLDLTLPNPGSFPPGALGAIRFGGVNGHNTVEPSVNSWSPRVGFAWSPRDKWSVRASYGIFQIQRGTENYAQNNDFPTLGYGLNPNGFIDNSSSAAEPSGVAFQLKTGPAPGSVSYPTVATLSPAFRTFNVAPFYPKELPLQYVQNALLSVQRSLPASHLLDVSYVFTKGEHLNFTRDMNQVPENQLANPANTGAFSPFRPLTQYTSIYAHLFDGWSNYNALQVRLIKRESHGVSYQFNYAWSKLLDTGTGNGHSHTIDLWQRADNTRANYGVSGTDATHNLTGSVNYELPFGEGRMYPVHGILNQIVGGWRITSIVQARSGIPFTPIVSDGSANANTFFGNAGDLALSGSTGCFCGYTQFPDRTGSGKLSNPTITKWFDPSAFTDPTNDGAIHVFGNSGRNILRGPRFVNLDIGLGKTFRIRESMRFELRADSYNAFNHPQFGQPNTNILSPDAGKITNTTNFGGPGRIIQLGGRFTF